MNLDRKIHELELRMGELEIVVDVLKDHISLISEGKCSNFQNRKPRYFGAEMTDSEYDLFMELNEVMYPGWREIPNFGN